MQPSPGKTATNPPVLYRGKITRAQIILVTFILLALVIDGLDVMILALIAPKILDDWQISKSALAPAMAAALAGMALGSAFGGWAGDRFGRRVVLIGSTFMFGVCTAFAALSRDANDLALLRLLSGVGFGAALPNGLALASEWMPAQLRPRIVSILSIGVPLGGFIGAPLAIVLLPLVGWRGCLFACGAFTLVVAILMLRGVPESASFLKARGRRQEAEAISLKITGSTQLYDANGIPEENAAPGSISGADLSESHQLLSAENIRMNIGVWLFAFFYSAMSYSIAAWAPVILSSNGMSLDEAIRASFLNNGAAIVGALLLPSLLTRFGSRALVIVMLIMCMIFMVAMMFVLSSEELAENATARTVMICLMTGLGGTTGLCASSLYTLASLGYPPSIRSTGAGVGLAFGRVGAITLIVSGGFLLDIRQDGLALLGALCAGLGISLIGNLIIDRHIMPSRPSA